MSAHAVDPHVHSSAVRQAAVGRALRAAAHPAILAAIVFMLINDHLLRWMYPSWWTGKLGDAAWLFFMPFAIAPLLAWVLPAAFPRRDAWVGGVACLLVGSIFAAIKTLPSAHAAFQTLFVAIFGWESIVLRDPTDLLTLPALWLAWRLWKSESYRARMAPRTLRVRAACVIALAALATVANSGPVDPGISCLHADGDAVYAVAAWGGPRSSFYRSDDGGLTWQELDYHANQYPDPENPYLPDVQCPSWGSEPWLVVGGTPGEFYRLTPGRYIERSTDEGRTWIVELHVSSRYVRPANEHYSGYSSPPRGPKAALYHETSGNLIVAMEWKGVVVRQPDGAWQWITVGPYAADIQQEQ